METYNYDSTVAPGFAPEGDMTSMLPSGNDMPAAPGFGPMGDVTPALPSENDMPAAPGFGPNGNVTPSLPGRPGSCFNCSNGVVVTPGNTNSVLWTWGVLSPFFSTSSSMAHVRFYNAAAIQEPLDIYLNGRLVVSNLDYMAFTNYLHIVPGVYRLTVYRRTNPGYSIIDTGVQFRGGNSYTLTILGTVGNFSVQLITS